MYGLFPRSYGTGSGIAELFAAVGKRGAGALIGWPWPGKTRWQE